MIADELGLKSGSLYSHISSKDEVLTLIVKTVADAFFEAVKVASETPGNPEERLRAMCRAHLEVIDRHGLAVHVYYEEWHRLNKKSRSEIAALRKAYGDRFTEVVKAGVTDGTFRDVDVPWAVLVILSACNWAVEWYSPKGSRNPTEIADGFMDVIVAGLSANGGRSTPNRTKRKKAKTTKAKAKAPKR